MDIYLGNFASGYRTGIGDSYGYGDIEIAVIHRLKLQITAGVSRAQGKACEEIDLTAKVE